MENLDLDIIFDNEDSDNPTVQSETEDKIETEEGTIATNKQIFDYLKNNLSSNILRVEPFFGDDTQDPITWWESFFKATKVNQWTEGKITRMLNAHLREEAEEWWSNFYEDNAEEDAVIGIETIKAAFLLKFCTQRWKNKWLKDLEGRRQGPNELVTSYYTAFRKLIRRADVDNTFNNNLRLRYFLRGLKPEVAPIVAMSAPENVNTALEQALRYEDGKDLINLEEPSRSCSIPSKEIKN